MAFFVCIFLLGLHTVCGDLRRQIDIVDPGFGVPVSGTYSKTCDVICDEETHETGVCASDGMFYKTHCDFNNAVCTAAQAGDTVTMVNNGPCVDLNTTCDIALHSMCSHNYVINTGKGRRAVATDYYCGSDKRTYTSACEFRQTQCRQQQLMSPTALTLDHVGKCVIDTSNQIMIDCTKYTTVDSNSQIAIETDVLPTITCPRNYQPVCALTANLFSFAGAPTGRTFSNECSVCQYMRSLHKLTHDNMVAYALHDGACTTNSIFG